MNDHNGHNEHTGHGAHGGHHGGMIADFRKRFWVSLGLTAPVLVLSPSFRGLFGLEDSLVFSGDSYLLLALATFVYFYGGYPFLSGFFSEVKSGRPGMMTLIAVAITVAYVYSAAVVLGLSGMIFFW